MKRVAIAVVLLVGISAGVVHADPLAFKASATLDLSNAVSQLTIAKAERDAALEGSAKSHWSHTFEALAAPADSTAADSQTTSDSPKTAELPARTAKLDMKLSATSIQIRIGTKF